MILKHILLIFLLTFVLLCAGGLIRAHGFVKDIPVSQVLFAIAAFILVKRKILRGKWMYFVLPLFILFWHTIAFLIDNTFSNFHEWEYVTSGTPNIFLCVVGAVYGSLLASGGKLRIAGITILLLSITFSAWYMTRGIDYWVNYCNVGNFTGKVKGDKITNWQQISNPSDNLETGHYRDKFVVLDFWSMSCVICFKKFPKLDSLNKQYDGDKRVIFEAVNLPVKDDSTKFETTRELNKLYSFKIVFADSTAWQKFDIDGVPTVMILKNDEIVFKGSIELAKDFLAENLK